MGKWIICHKDGSVLTDVNDELVVIHGLEYSDSWMGECFVSIDFKRQSPIGFEIGDYIMYRGERFELNYVPGKEKQARKDTYGEGFTYDGVKFNSLRDELSRAEFLDVVLHDNQLHYTTLPKFPFYVETIDDLLDRIQANLNEQIGDGKWKIFSRNKERSMQRGCTAEEWNAVYGDGTNDSASFESKSITIDTQKCWDALALVNTQWNINFVIRGRNIYVGTAGVMTDGIFKYGLGKGLYKVDQNADSDQSIITRLRAYGSEKNLPDHYYADLGIKYKVGITKVGNAASFVELYLDLDYISTYFTEPRKYISSGSTGEQTNGFVLRVTFDFKTIITGYVTGTSNNKCRFYSELKGSQADNGDEESKDALDAFISQVKSGSYTKLYITSGINEKTIPSENKEYAENLPNNMAISRLMLPGFPTLSLREFWDTMTEEEKKYVNPTGKEHIFSNDKYRPYIDSLNIDKIGLRSDSKFFDTDDKANGIVEIYPTIEEMVVGGVRVDEIYKGSEVDDDGRFVDGQSVKNIDIYLNPAIDFDINGLKDDDFSICMKDGRCGGRSFKVASSTKESGTWRLTIERVKDDALGLYFPYKDYQIKKNDHFVLTGIRLPDSYVRAASLKLLKYAIALLDKNDYTRYVYQPKVDEIFMARQHDAAMADKSGATRSLHDTLRAGDIMRLSDDDLGIKADVTIDQLIIKEEDGKIPAYEITLREEKEVGTIQKIQQSISSLESGNGIASEPTIAQVKSMFKSEGGRYFLSKLEDDVASGAITFEKMQKFLSGFVSAGRAILQKGFAIDENGYGFDENGNIIADSLKSTGFDKADNEGFGMEMESAGTSHLYLSNLTVWGKMFVNILEIMKTKYAGGNIYLSAAGGTIVKVVPVGMWDDDESEWAENPIEEAIQGWKCYILADDGDNAVGNPWQEGDQVRCQSMGNLLGTRYAKATNKSYWRTIPEHGVSSFNEYIYNDYGTPAYNGKMFYWIVLGKHSKDFDGYTEENAPVGTTDIPEAGDSIVLDGSRKDTSRQGVLQLSSYGSGAPSIVGLREVSDYTHEKCAIFELSYDYVRIFAERFKLIAKDNKVVEITNFRGEWDPNEKYYKNDQVSHNNAIWTCIKDTDFQTEPTDGSTYWRKEVYGQKGEDGSSFKVLGTAVKHFTNADDIGGELLTTKEYLFDDTSGLPDGVASPCIATYMKVGAGHTWIICKSNDGDSYMIGDDLWTNSGTAWLNIGNVKGVSISSTSVTYGVSASGTQEPSSWYSIIPPTTDEYPYLWTRTVVNYTDGKSTTSYSVSHNGKDGEKGETGKKGADAITIQLVGAPLIFDAGSDGIVPKGVTNYARLYVTVGEKDVSEYVGQPYFVPSEGMNVSHEDGYVIERREYNEKMAWYLGIKSDAISKVYLSDNKTEVSATSGYITFVFAYGANQYVGQIPFQVNVAKYTGELTLTNKQFEVKMRELSTNYDNLPLKTTAALTDYTTSVNESARKISLEASKKAVDDNNAVIKKAGLEVTADGIKLYGDKITITNDNGETTTALFSNGKINASLIDADQIEVKHLWAKSNDGASKVGYFGNTEEDACKLSDGTLAPLFIGGDTAAKSPFYVTSNGAMHATSGKIGGFSIDGNSLYHGDTSKWATSRTENLSQIGWNFIRINQAITYGNSPVAYQKIGIGANANPSDMEDTETRGGTALFIRRSMNTMLMTKAYKPAIIFESDNALNRNIAMRLKGGLQVHGGVIEHGRVMTYSKKGDTNVLDVSFATTFTLRNATSDSTIGFYMPTLAEIRRQLGITDASEEFCVPINIFAASSSERFLLCSQYVVDSSISKAESGRFVNNDGEWNYANNKITFAQGDCWSFSLTFMKSVGYYFQITSIIQ
jgi:hypothetical protein